MTIDNTIPFCEISLTILEAIDSLQQEQRYPTLREILFEKMCPTECSNFADKRVNWAVVELAVNYKKEEEV